MKFVGWVTEIGSFTFFLAHSLGNPKRKLTRTKKPKKLSQAAPPSSTPQERFAEFLRFLHFWGFPKNKKSEENRELFGMRF